MLRLEAKLPAATVEDGPMTTPAFELRLVEDSLHAGSALELPADNVNRVVYVAHGTIAVSGAEFRDDSAWHGRGAARIAAGPTGAAVWRFELIPTGSPLTSLSPKAGYTRPKLTAPLEWPIADSLLVRADSVAFPPGGCAYLHTHQGPGIRCLIEGGVRIDTDGHSTSYAPGSPWFEAGPVPVFAQAAADRASRFIRVMILPARLKGASSISYVNAVDRDKPKSQSYKIFVDALIDV
jgi:hypothetical protein